MVPEEPFGWRQSPPALDTVQPTSPKCIQQLASVEYLLDLFQFKGDIYNGGDQCRVKAVQSKRDGQEYVMKIQRKESLRNGDEELFRSLTERMMNMPDSAHVVKVYACYETPRHFHTLLEVCRGGDLFDFYRSLLLAEVDARWSQRSWPPVVERRVRVVVREVLAALQYLHAQGLVHRDVKLENLVFKEPGADVVPRVELRLPDSGQGPRSPKVLKLIDFDFTVEWAADSPPSRDVLGTDGYIAPEAYLGNAGPKGDVFSLGVIMYVLVAGRFPFESIFAEPKEHGSRTGSPGMERIYEQLAAHEIEFGAEWDQLPEAKAFCQQLLEVDVGKRPDAAEALLHPWITSEECFSSLGSAPVTPKSSTKSHLSGIVQTCDTTDSQDRSPKLSPKLPLAFARDLLPARLRQLTGL